MFPKVSHIIFDVNDTLINTKTVEKALKAVENILRNNGITESLSTEFREKLAINTTVKFACDFIAENYTLQLTRDELKTAFHNELINAIKNYHFELMPGAERLVNYLKNHGIPMAIAATALEANFKETVAPKFGDFFTVANYFNHFVFGDDPEVQNIKPHPDMYRVCGKRFNPQPLNTHNILVFEDIGICVDGAIDAGMQCCLIPSNKVINPNPKATIIINSLEDFRPELFGLPPF